MEAIVIYYKIIYRNLPQGSVEILDKPQLEFWLLYRQIFQTDQVQDTSRKSQLLLE